MSSGYTRISNATDDGFALNAQSLCNYHLKQDSRCKIDMFAAYWLMQMLFQIKDLNPRTYRTGEDYNFNKWLASYSATSVSKTAAIVKDLKESGYLKVYRYPSSGNANRFDVTYELLKDAPSGEIESLVNLTMSEGRKLNKRIGGRVTLAPTVGMGKKSLKIERDVLLDKKLTLRAKGLYIIITRAIKLSENKEDFMLTKNILRQWSGLKEYAFTTVWNELKSAGYLLVKQCHERYITWEYTLYSERNEAAAKYYADKRALRQERWNDYLRYKAPGTANTKPKRTGSAPIAATDLKQRTTRDIQLQLGYDDILNEYPKGTFTAKYRYDGYLYEEQHTVTQGELDEYISIWRLIYKSTKSVYSVDGENVSLSRIQAAFANATAEDLKNIIATVQNSAQEREIIHKKAYVIAVAFKAITEAHR